MIGIDPLHTLEKILMTEIKTESSSNQPRILITGVSGLIGTILLKYLTETYSNRYQVFGLDLNINISSRYQANNNDDLQVETVLPFSSEKFFQCDVTDRIKLHHIIAEQKIDIIIHLAAVLEDDPDHAKIFRVNTEGTKNVFEARKFSSFIFI
jgi:nucleoside-diphosphate-sugar epimerase